MRESTEIAKFAIFGETSPISHSCGRRGADFKNIPLLRTVVIKLNFRGALNAFGELRMFTFPIKLEVAGF